MPTNFLEWVGSRGACEILFVAPQNYTLGRLSVDPFTLGHKKALVTKLQLEISLQRRVV
jgi:hypothetical protein